MLRHHHVASALSPGGRKYSSFRLIELSRCCCCRNRNAMRSTLSILHPIERSSTLTSGGGPPPWGYRLIITAQPAGLSHGLSTLFLASLAPGVVHVTVLHCAVSTGVLISVRWVPGPARIGDHRLEFGESTLVLHHHRSPVFLLLIRVLSI